MTSLAILSLTRGAGAQPTGFGFDVNGDGKASSIQIGGRDGITLEKAVRSHDPAYQDVRIAYDMHARANGFDPRTIRSGSPADKQVLADLTETLRRTGADGLAGKGGVASQMETMRHAAAATVAARNTALGTEALAAAARAPGAQAAARAAPGLASAAVAVARHPAGAAGLAAGGGIAIASGAMMARANQTGAKAQPQTAANLDTNRDGRLECREIGRWIPDVGFDSRSANSRAYQTHVTGVPGMDFEVLSPASGRMVRFDGCIDEPNRTVLKEAKADHGNLLMEWSEAYEATGDQAIRQQQVKKALNIDVEWHAQTKTDTDRLLVLFRRFKVTLPVTHDPMPHISK